MDLLKIDDLRVHFYTSRGILSAVSGVSLSAGKGEIVGLVGESGCGKTMTALSVMGLVPENGDAQGSILFEGKDILKLSGDEIRSVRGDRLSMIFQEPMTALNPVLTVGFQLCEPLVLHRDVSREEAKRRALEMLDLVQVPNAAERMKCYPHQLSGGLCQRVMIAMALICEPDLLIADEPTTALDVTIQAQILALIGDLRHRLNTAILMITHDLGVIAELCDKVYVMYAGHVMEEANVFSLFDTPLHPYTTGLMRSMPDTGMRRRGDEGLYSIPGLVPNLLKLPAGCPFAPRCDYCLDACREGLPPLIPVSTKHAVRCWLHASKGGELNDKRNVV